MLVPWRCNELRPRATSMHARKLQSNVWRSRKSCTKIAGFALVLAILQTASKKRYENSPQKKIFNEFSFDSTGKIQSIGGNCFCQVEFLIPSEPSRVEMDRKGFIFILFFIGAKREKSTCPVTTTGFNPLSLDLARKTYFERPLQYCWAPFHNGLWEYW